MADSNGAKRWNSTARFYDLLAHGAEKRWGPAKQALFGRMGVDQKILFAALGTGLDIAFFPPGRTIQAIDISPGMLAQAQSRITAYPGAITAHCLDITALPFPDASFDQVFTSCTFCSVPDPHTGLAELYRVMRPGAELGMFEHTGSHYVPFNWLLDMCNPLCRHIGPEMNRDTVANVRKAGFRIHSVEHHFLDVVKTIRALRPEQDRG
ncbi:MAG: class I SAM-dependent methyltransferase [Magnetococcales bacterium]|nr:class I SAM-dependent methyltransferase [Magnetococcales bacterium]